MKKILLGILEAIIVLALVAVIGFFGYKMVIENRDSDSANYAGQNEEKINTLLNNLKADLDTQTLESVLINYGGSKIEFRSASGKASLYYSNSAFTYTNFLGENKVYKLINYNVKFDKENVEIIPTKASNTSSTFDIKIKYTYPTGEKNETSFTYISNNAQLKYCVVEGGNDKCYNTVYVTYNYNYPTGEKLDEQFLERVDEKYSFPETKKFDGYHLAGWYDEKENGRLYDETSIVTESSNGLILYAIWEPNIYKVTLDSLVDGSSFIYYKYNTVSEKGCIYYVDSNLTKCVNEPIPSISSTSGKYFDGFYTSKDGLGTQYINSNGRFTNDLYKVAANNGLNLYINWTTKSYSISYNLNGGTSGVNSPTFGTTGRAVNISKPTKPGFKFKGWTATNLGTNAKHGTSVNKITSSFDGTKPVEATFFMNLRENSGTVILSAVWEETKYNISYNLNGGCFGTTYCDKDLYKYDPLKGNGILYSDTVTLPNPIKPGFKFKGWTAVGIYADAAAYIEYGSSIEKKWDGFELIEPKDVSPETGFSFKRLSALSGGTVTFIANWEAIGYKIEIDTAGGKMIDEAPETVGFTDVIKVPKPVKEGYDFAGWKVTGVDNLEQAKYGASSQSITQKFTNPGSDGSYLAKGEYFVALTTTEDKVIKFEATWDLGTYTIVYNATGGTGHMDETKCERDKDCLLRKNIFVKEEYEFSGWGTSLNSGVVYKDNDKVVNLVESGTKTLYAIWKKK